MRFRTTILEADGSISHAVLDASDEQSLHDRLHHDGRTLVDVAADRRGATSKPQNVTLSSRRLLLLSQALHEALDAGVPLLVTIRAVAEQESDARILALLEDVADSIAAGRALSEALAVHSRAFPPIYVAMVRAGEQSGSLPEVLASMIDFLEWRLEISSTVKQAMVYPAVVIAAGYGMVMFLLSFVVPRLGDVLTKMGGQLPAASRALIDCSQFVAANIVWLVLASIAAFVGSALLLRRPAVQGGVLGAVARLPVVNDLVRTVALAQFTRTFGVLLRAGLLMTAALELAAAAVTLPSMRQGVESVRQRLVGGVRLGEALAATAVLPPVALSMVAVGEEAGRLPVTFDRLSRLYDREVRAKVKRALGLLEPVVTVVLGVLVGGIAVLVVGTIYSAMRGIGR